MDPKQALIDLINALSNPAGFSSRADAIDAAVSLAEWLSNGGFMPECSIEAESHGPDGSEYVLKVAL